MRHSASFVAGLLAAGLLLGAVARGDDDPPAPATEPVQRTEDVIYGRKDGMALTLDVFQPAKANRCGIIYVVNGGWASSKATLRRQNGGPEYDLALLDRGDTVFAVVTSWQPRDAIPELMSDTLRAVRFVRANAGGFGVGPGRLGIGGVCFFPFKEGQGG